MTAITFFLMFLMCAIKRKPVETEHANLQCLHTAADVEMCTIRTGLTTGMTHSDADYLM